MNKIKVTVIHLCRDCDCEIKRDIDKIYDKDLFDSNLKLFPKNYYIEAGTNDNTIIRQNLICDECQDIGV